MFMELTLANAGVEMDKVLVNAGMLGCAYEGQQSGDPDVSVTRLYVDGEWLEVLESYEEICELLIDMNYMGPLSASEGL